uniref:Ankyrin repeat and LEM domain-containing protein 1 n=2 Tax=Bactrocera dorsalis TaxID=27457 RepID=A0A034VLV7_BACDO
MSDPDMTTFQVDQRSNFISLILLDALEDGNESDIYAIIAKNKVDASYVPIERGISPLHYACGMDNAAVAVDIIKIFLEGGADANVRSNENMTPLHVAAIFGRVDIVVLLLKYGARHDLLDDERKTPIHYAIEECHFDVLEVIRDHIFQHKYELVRKRSTEYVSDNGNYSIRGESNKREEEGSNVTPVNRMLSNVRNNDSGNPDTPNNKYTPNRVHYNYDVTSPYYINITHRRHRPQPIFPPIGSPPNSKNKSHDFECEKFEGPDSNPKEDQEKESTDTQSSVNVFHLTEKNLKELSKTSNLDRSCISMIEAWRKKVESSRAKRSILRCYSDVDEMVDEVMKSDHLNFTNTILQENAKKVFEDNESETNPIMISNLSLGAIIQKAAQAHVLDQEEQGPDPDSSYHTVPAIIENELSGSIKKQPSKNSPKIYLKEKSDKNPSGDYILQMAEAYVHTDDENGLVFYETKLLSSQKSANNCEQQNLDSTVSTNDTHILDYETDELRAELAQFGDPPGPITKSTKRLYIKRLIKYKRNAPELQQINTNGKQNAPESAKLSVELQRTIRSPEHFALIPEYQKYECKSTEYFANLQNKHKMREGHLKQSFIYMLIDPRISCNLPGESLYIERHKAWVRFLESVFYVGKGKTSRPYSHLYEAMKLHSRVHSHQKITNSRTDIVQSQRGKASSIRKQTLCLDVFKANIQKPLDNKKLERILDIWRCGKGVVCLHVFHNILPSEAYTREAAIIDAFGIQHLTNHKRGDYYGPAQTWTMKEKKMFGISLLYKAMQIYLAEGESQLSPSDLI